jgi:hypothetical protein
MYSPTEVHRITALLYAVTRRTDMTVTLGDRVLDKTTAKLRDVDIVIACVDSTALLAIEVKAERRPLDTPLVEGLCQKLLDMPSITNRHIVSLAGFTQPALLKAEYHGVECLRLVVGRVPPFEPINISQVDHVNDLERRWVNVGFEVNLSDYTGDSGTIDMAKGSISARDGVIPGDVFLNQTLTRVLADEPLPLSACEREIRQVVRFDPPVFLLSGSQKSHIHSLTVFGTIVNVQTRLPLDHSVYLERADGSCFAGAAVVEIKEGLFGIGVTPGGTTLTVFRIPHEIRDLRPNREVITLSWDRERQPNTR